MYNKVELCGVNTGQLPVLTEAEKRQLLTLAHAGDKAARLLMDMLADPHAEPQMIKLDYELKCRASTGDDNSDENVWSL